MKKIKINLLTFLSLFAGPCLRAQISPANNKIGVDVSTYHVQNPAYTYDSCFVIGRNLGMSQVGLFLNWTTLETAPNTYNFSLLDIANAYYPAYNMPVDLNLNPINTNRIEVPSDLNSLAFDNVTFINRYKILLDSVKAHLPNVTLSSLVIGSEVDATLGNSTTLWTQYTQFYNAVSAYAKTLWPGLKVAVELQFPGLITQFGLAQQLNTNSDYIGISYYPLFADFTAKPVYTVPFDFDTLVALYPSKPLCFYQYGYPSSPICNSSFSAQASFITETFQYWDVYAAHILLIDFTWMTDLDTAAVSYYKNYYGVADSVFLEFIRSLGLREWNGNGVDKPALNALRCQAKQRGYNNLPVSCLFTSVQQQGPLTNSDFLIYPNPASTQITVRFKAGETAHFKMFSVFGQQVLDKLIQREETMLDVSALARGIYFAQVIRNDQQLAVVKLVISN